jgi:hypothetical protein
MLADRRYCYPLTISDFASRQQLSPEKWPDRPSNAMQE